MPKTCNLQIPLPCCHPLAEDKMLTPEEYKRYSKQISLPEVGLMGQQRLKAAKVLVVGAGGLGCPALQYLAAAGVGTIGIADADTVDLTNLQRQILYGTDSLGKPKAAIAAKTVQVLNPYASVIVHEEMVTAVNSADMLSAYDVIIDATDNMETRYIINDACNKLGKPWVYAGIYQHEGQLAVFNYPAGIGPTYRCLYPETEGTNAPDDCNIAGVLGILPGVMGTLQANECLKIILDKGHVLAGKLLVMNLLSLENNLFEFKRTIASTLVTP